MLTTLGPTFLAISLISRLSPARIVFCPFSTLSYRSLAFRWDSSQLPAAPPASAVSTKTGISRAWRFFLLSGSFGSLNRRCSPRSSRDFPCSDNFVTPVRECQHHHNNSQHDENNLPAGALAQAVAVVKIINYGQSVAEGT